MKRKMELLTKPHEYVRENVIIFKRTKEIYGGLSNMAIGFEIKIDKIVVKSSEALYQACRYPHRDDIQEEIIKQTPMKAKIKSMSYNALTRPDWDQVRVPIMKWCVEAKLACNWNEISEILLSTGEKPIVEESRKDMFWGAIPQRDGKLKGVNQLGKLLVDLRNKIKERNKNALRKVMPLDIENFRLLGKAIPVIEYQNLYNQK